MSLFARAELAVIIFLSSCFLFSFSFCHLSYSPYLCPFFLPFPLPPPLSPPPFSSSLVSTLRLFCKVTEFTRKNLDMFFPSVKKPSAKVLSPSSLEGLEEANHLADTDKSWLASKCILSLLQSFIQSMDIKLVWGDERWLVWEMS